MSELTDELERIRAKYESQLIDSKCTLCGTDIKIFPTEKENICTECSRKKAEYKRRLERLNYILPLGYRHMSFANFKIRDNVVNLQAAVEVAKSFVLDDTGVYLWGGAGQGKTHLLCAALRECVLQGQSAKLLRYSAELQHYKELKLKREDFFEEYTKCKNLFIDDFGCIGTKDDAIDILYGILQRRIENKKGKKIFITANMPIQQIDDSRVASRISGMCTGYRCHSNGVDTEKYVNVVEIKGEDIRLTGEL